MPKAMVNHLHLLLIFVALAPWHAAFAQSGQHQLAASTTHPSAQADTLSVLAVWSRAMPPVARTGAIYFEIHNRGETADRLLAARSPKAGRLELHTHINENGVMKMREVPAVEVEPGATVMFQPGGLHVMMFELAGPLVAGERFPLELQFEHAGVVQVEVAIKDPMAGAGHGMQHGQAGHHPAGDGMKSMKH